MPPSHGRSDSKVPLLVGNSDGDDNGWRPAPVRKRRPLSRILGYLIASGTVASLFTFVAISALRAGSCRVVVPAYRYANPGGSGSAYNPAVVGPPAARYRDNLRNDTKYITSWHDAGWTNDVMSIANMVYMGVLTGRVPILPPFTPMHVGADAGSIAFGEVFDLPRWSRDIGIPLVDWYEVKDNSTDIVEGLGGWSVWQTVDGAPRWSVATHILNLDVSYTRVPDNVAVGLNNHAYFWALARLGFQGDRQRAMEQAQPRAGPRTGIVLEPDDHVLMFDFLYFVCVQEVFEFEKEYSPAWRHVLTHAHFTPRIEALATGAMRTLLDVPTGAPIPPFIAMHIRHGDFGNYCGEHNRGNCFASLDTWAEYVREVRDELLERKGVDAATVLVTSDESNEGWWDEVASLGWTRVDHNVLGTVSKYGKWYPVFIDAVIQASGEGFVGTAGSTMSLLAMRRTQDWRGGIGRLVQWNEIR